MRRSTGILLLSAALPGLGSCSTKPALRVATFTTTAILSCASDEAQNDRLVCLDVAAPNVIVRPFDSGISLKVYYPEDQRPDLAAIEQVFVDTMAYYSAVFDRHYSYRYRSELTDEFEPLTNVRTVNNAIAALDSDAAKSSVELELPELLYQGLRQAYDFTINSSLKYNFAVGTLSSLWDRYIDLAIQTPADRTAEELAIIQNHQVVAYRDPPTADLAAALSATPTASELPKIFRFSDAEHSLTVNRIKENASEYHTSITLGGYGKGKAVEAFADAHPELALLLDGGTSSLKAQNSKANGSPWKIKITNPVYQEELSWANVATGLPVIVSDINPEDFYYQQSDDFNLSTSGYYNNYYYVPGETPQLRHHIVDSTTGYSHQFFDSTSVFISDSALGDMYSTALMNCDSLEEAETLRKKLDEIYGIETWAFYQTHPKLQKNGVNAYIPADRMKYFKSMPGTEISYPSITKREKF